MLANHAWTLAEAFSSAGAHAVIAARTIVADEHAAAMSLALVEQLDLDDGPGTLARARAALEQVTPAPAWADFRVWTQSLVFGSPDLLGLRPRLSGRDSAWHGEPAAPDAPP